MFDKRPTKRLRTQYEQRKGYTLPGYNYLGPGNPMDNGPPTDADDRIAVKHDEEYGFITDSGSDPYWNWNAADEEALPKFGHGYGGYIAKGFFGAKKAAHRVGAIGYNHPKSSKKQHFIKQIAG